MKEKSIDNSPGRTFNPNHWGFKNNIGIGIIFVLTVSLISVGLLASQGPDEPAELEVSNLTISPSEIEPGQSVKISVHIKNPRDKKYSKELSLTLSDKVLTKKVNLDSSESKWLKFNLTLKKAGNYKAKILGKSKGLTVKKPPLKLMAPEWITAGEKAEIKVISHGKPVENAKVWYTRKPFFSENNTKTGSDVLTGEDGIATFTLKKSGDYKFKAKKEGYVGQSEVLFESKSPKPFDWIFNKSNRKKGNLKPFPKGEDYLRINTYPSQVGKTFIWPNIRGRDKNFNVWDDYEFQCKFRFNREKGGIGIGIRRNPQGRYAVTINPWGGIQLWKQYPIEEYTDQEATKQQVILESEKISHNWGNSWHNLRVRASGRKFSVYVDGSPVLTYKEDFKGKIEGNVQKSKSQPKPISEVKGRIKVPFREGIIAFETQGKVDIAIDNVIVREILMNPLEDSEAIRVYPEGSNRIKIRGAKGKGLPYLRFHDAKTLGANWAFRDRAYWVSSDDFSITPKPGAASKKLIKDTIKRADYRGMKFFYTTHLWWEGEPVGNWDSVPSSEREKFLNSATKLALESAKFAEKNGVEMFAPIQNLHEYIPHEIAYDWYQSIVPKLRKIYSGKIIKGKNPLHQGIENTEFDFSRFDYVTINTGASGSYTDYREKIQKMLQVGNRWSEKYGDKGLIIYPINGVSGEEFVLSELKKGKSIEEVKNRFNEIFFQETIGHISGVFLDGQWYEKVNAKLYSRMSGKGELTHSTGWYWGYQNNKVAQLISKYFTSAPGADEESSQTKSEKGKITVPLSQVLKTTDNCKLTPEQWSKEEVKVPMVCVRKEYLKDHGFVGSSK